VKERQPKRKAERATHLKSSPFKNMMQEYEKKQRKGEENSTIVEERNGSKEETRKSTVVMKSGRAWSA